jgi:hypothetical protein
MGMGLLRTFVSRRVQPLRLREITMRMYPGPSYLDHPFYVELDDMKINTQVGGSLLIGLIRILAQPTPFKGRGGQPLGESA